MGGKGTTGNYSMYVNPFMVVNSMKFTKHFYIEGQRIVSKLGDMGENQELLNPKDTTRAGNNGNHPIDWDNKKEHLKDFLLDNFEELGLTGAVFAAGKSGKVPYGQIKKYYRNPNSIFNGGENDSTTNNSSSGNKAELLQFYYHPDHLGSSSYITNVSGEVYQHMEYFPFGETFIEERTDAEYTSYLYNGKEFDEEIGLYYYGARYYDPRTSVWQSVDQLAEKYPAWSPYVYTYNNPIRYNDPTGMEGEDPNAWQRFKESAKFTFSEIGKLAKNSGLGKAVSAITGLELKGDGGTQNGGIPLVTEKGGASPTKQQAEHTEEQTNVEVLLDAMGTKVKGTTVKPGELTVAKTIKKAGSMGKEIKEAMSKNQIPSSNSASTPISNSEIVTSWGTSDSSGVYYTKDSSSNGQVTYTKRIVGSSGQTSITKEEFEKRY